MDSSISSIVSSLGAGSGVDMVKLANDLTEARFAAQVARLEAQRETLDTRISSSSLLRNQLTQLASALGDRVRTGDLAPAPSIAAPSVASVSSAPGSIPSGNYSLEVTQLAQNQTLALNALPSANDLVGEGTLTLRFGTINGSNFNADPAQDPVDITVSATDTLTTLAAKINASGSGISAYIANGSNGAQLVLKGAEGAAQGFTVETSSANASPSATAGDLTYLGWDPSANSGQLRQTAQDALFKLDTIEMTSASNKVTNLPEGLQLQLTGTNIGAPTQIFFASKTNQISSVMNDFVSALGEITSQLKSSEELGSDPGMRTFRRALSGLSTTVIMPNAAPGEPNTLSSLGLTIARDGSFSLDNKKLEKALADNPEAVSAMFTTGLYGVFATIDKLARSVSTSGDPGSLGGSITRYNKQIEANNAKLAKIAEQKEVLRERMTSQFAATDRRVAASNSTLSFLQNQIKVWNSSDR